LVGFLGSRSFVALHETVLGVEICSSTLGEKGRRKELLKVVGENDKEEIYAMVSFFYMSR
jgi:hypothetical protein